MSTPVTARADSQLQAAGGGKHEKKKFGLVLQGGGALGAYEAGAIEYLYEIGMECAIVAGASSGAMNAVTLAGARGYPPQVLRELWGMLTVNPPVPFLPPMIRRSWSMFGVPHMYTPRLDYWTMPGWTYFTDTTPFKKTLEELLDWDQVRDPEHMRLFVSASGVEDAETAYFSNLDPDQPFQPEHVLASGSIPPGFPWTTVRHRAYWDGGLTDNTPLKPVIENLRGDEPETMPIFMIDVHSTAAPQPANMQQVLLRMFEILLHNNLKSDSQTARRYTRFISILKQVDQQLPADAPVRRDNDWDAVMNYALIRQIRMIEMNKPAGESASDFSRETILRRLSTGYDQMRSALEETPLAA
jgi:predicted acylesterase/phospholipase RssA